MDKKIAMKDKIAKTLSTSDKPMHIKEIADNFTGIPESTVRGRLNDNVGKLFDRVGKGLYVLKGDKATIGLINGDARKLDDKFDSNSIDLLISDHAWLDEKSHKGGSRNFASTYDCFKYEDYDFEQKHKALKKGGFLVEFLPEKNANNRKYLRQIEDMAEKSGLEYFAEVNITGGNSNIGRKKKFISSAYFFTKGESRKLKIWDEKLSKMIKEGEMKYMKKEYMVDFKKVYSEVLNVEDNTDRKGDNFDIKVSKTEAEYILNEMKKNEDFKGITLMCKEYGQDNDWEEVNTEDLHDDNETGVFKLDDDYKTIEIYLDEQYKDKGNYFIRKINSRKDSKDLLKNNFLKHCNEGELAQFKKINKIMEKIKEDQRKFDETFSKSISHSDQQMLDVLGDRLSLNEKQLEEFYMAFEEYIEFLQGKNSYKMGTKTILPEVFVGDNLGKKDKRHESQKPLNTLEDIILQTSNSGETVVEQFAGSYIGAEAIINLGNEGKGWRNYVGIELDKQRVDEAKNYLKEKYKDLKLFTTDDFYGSCEEPEKQLVQSKGGLQLYKKLEVVKNRINDDLKNTLKLSFLQFELESDDNLEAQNFKKDKDKIMTIGFLASNMKPENRVLNVIVNKQENIFEIVNRDGKLINKSSIGGNLDESLIKLYNTFM